jgi:Fe-S oxidoreductase
MVYRFCAFVVSWKEPCGYVLKSDYIVYVGGPDAELVAERTYDAAEYLMRVHKAEGTTLDTDFGGHVPATVTYQFVAGSDSAPGGTTIAVRLR